MNWTAILALLALAFVVTGGSLIFAWACNRACEASVLHVSDTARREADEHDEEMGKLNRDYADLLKRYEDAERRARRRQSRTGQRAGETVSLESVRDPDFTGGLDPVEYLNRLHAGVGDHDKDCACAECLECRPARARSTPTGNTTNG